MAEATAQNQATQGQASQGTPPKMPELDFAGLHEYLKSQKKGNAPANPQGPTGSQQPAPEQNAEQPQSAQQTQQTQTTPSPLRMGEIFTDENGQQWQWNELDFNVVPEETKDEEVDSLDEEDEVGESEGEDNSDYDANLERGLDIALQILREGGPGEKDDGEEAVAKDEALSILFEACDEVLGNVPTEDDQGYTPSYVRTDLDGKRTGGEDKHGYSTPTRASVKQEGGWETTGLEGMSKTHQKLGNYSQIGENKFLVGGNLPAAQVDAKKKARGSHRATVAARWEDCKAKDKYKCRFHGAAYMTDMFGQILAANGIQTPKVDIDIQDTVWGLKFGKNDPIPYTLKFATPVDTPADTRLKCIREFVMKHPGIIVKMPKGSIATNVVGFEVSGPEYVDDIPVDAPTMEDYQSQHIRDAQRGYKEESSVRGAVSYGKFDKMGKDEFFNLLREHPTNSVELNEDMMRYVNAFPECLPEGISVDDIRDLYARFKKANDEKKGLRAYIMHGEVMDMAEALAQAAEKGLEKEGKAYYGVAKEVYDIAAQIFTNTEALLWDEYEKISDEIQSMPSSSALQGGRDGEGTHTVYFGTEWRAKGKRFPLNMKEEVKAPISEIITEYQRTFNDLIQVDDAIMTGCQTRSPMMVLAGIQNARDKLGILKGVASEIGRMEDRIISSLSDSWRQKNGIKKLSAGDVKSKQNPKPAEKVKASVETDTRKKEDAKQENKNPQKAPEKAPETPAESVPVQEPEVKEDVKPAEPAKEEPKPAPQQEVPQKPSPKAEKTDKRQSVKEPVKSPEPAVEAKGKGLDIIKGMDVPDKPTLEEATAMNKQFADLETHLRDITDIFQTETSDSPEYKAAESEMKAVKSEIDGLMKRARGKGYEWTKDTPKFGVDGPSDKRPFDVPTNFHISGIKDEAGQSVSVPYKPPKAKPKPTPVSKSAESRNAGDTGDDLKTQSSASKRSGLKKDSYPAEFDSIVEKIGDIGVGPYKGKTFSDLIDDGYIVRSQRVRGTGQTEWFFGKPSTTNKSGIENSKEHPPLWLKNVFEKRMGGDPNDEVALKDFIDVLLWKVKDRDYATDLFDDIGKNL